MENSQEVIIIIIIIESGISSKTTNLCSGENPKRHLPGRLIAISYSNDSTQQYTYEIQRGLHVYKILGKDKQPYVYEWYQDINQKLKQNLILRVMWKSDLTDKIKRSFFQTAVVSILLYGRLLQTILNESWRQHPTKQPLYGHLPPITKAIKVRRTRHAGHSWRSRDELISDVLLWTPSHGPNTQELCADMRCSPEDQPKAMDDIEEWREMVRDIHADGTTWWWWWGGWKQNPDINYKNIQPRYINGIKEPFW